MRSILMKLYIQRYGLKTDMLDQANLGLVGDHASAPTGKPTIDKPLQSI